MGNLLTKAAQLLGIHQPKTSFSESATKSSSKSGRNVSYGCDTPGIKEATNDFSKASTPEGTPKKAQRLLGTASRELDNPTTQKTSNFVENFFNDLFTMFKDFKRDLVKQQAGVTLSQAITESRGKNAENTTKNPHSTALESTMSKFIVSHDPQVTTSDQANLNSFFSSEHIDQGVDALQSLFSEGKTESVKNILKVLTPENRSKVSEKLSETNDSKIFELIHELEGELSSANGKIDQAVEQLKEAEDTNEIDILLKEIRIQSQALCPSNCSTEVRLITEFEEKSSALEQLPEGSPGRAALEQDLKELIDDHSEVFTNHLQTLYSHPTEIDRANQTIISIAKIDPDKAGRILYTAVKKSTVQAEAMDPIAESVISKLSSAKARAGVVAGALKQEVEMHSKSEPGNLLRSNTISSKLLSQLLQSNILPHFQQSDTLQNALSKLPEEDVVVFNESQQKIISAENQTAIESCISDTLEAVKDIAVDSTNEDLNIFYAMCQDVQASVEKKFGKETGAIIPINFLFLRGVNSWIITDTESGKGRGIAKKYKGKQRKNAILMSKVMQNMANRIEFKNKEQHMLVFNPFLESGKGPLQEIGEHLLA